MTSQRDPDGMRGMKSYLSFAEVTALAVLAR
jgi:hypothetical protein